MGEVAPILVFEQQSQSSNASSGISCMLELLSVLESLGCSWHLPFAWLILSYNTTGRQKLSSLFYGWELN